MKFSTKHKKHFVRHLLSWHSEENVRSFPWKSEKDPYKIWLSEIILQQTRSEQGLPYYLRFVEKYPAIGDLANAKDEAVFRLWQGLGYYNRCKNLLETSRFIARDLKGKFPDRFNDLIKLKGVGSYTAAAIASFAFNLPHAVLDGNVCRLLSRFFGIDLPVDSSSGKNTFQNLAQYLLPVLHGASYNQAIMDYGAVVCKPVAPNCEGCGLKLKCFAFNKTLVEVLPIKSKKTPVRKRYFHYLFLIAGNSVWLRKRTEKDIWQNLFEPFLIESDQLMHAREIVKHPHFRALALSQDPEFCGVTSQRLTHQIIEAVFFTHNLNRKIEFPENYGEWTEFQDLKNYAFPKTLVSFLENNIYF